ncbi:fimbrial protein [Serratia fonticola]|uniref:fimbrial protein n=1 Tax=Serratia fonticola TaxID=47917 RepID=UPI00217B4D4C|nr:fimbrial protein [Serratia fonticola]CAI1218251.1 fimbrial protein [Serratia fonticola]CAI1224223.1 fimbrial protein [Serratia fonticola]
MKKVLIASSIFAAVATSGFANAGSTIEFLGEITDSTCDVTLEGGSSSTVTLPTVSKDLMPAANASAGRTSFALNAANCTLGNGLTKVSAFFNGSNTGGTDANNVDNVTGYLNNLAADPATTEYPTAAQNVKLRLIDGTNGSFIKAGYTDQVTSAGYITVDGSGNARMPYAVEYITVGGAASAGPVRGVVVYDLQYQ